jgi:branched-chain amino acid aminotransferase
MQIYTRINHISTDEMLGVRTPKSSKIYAICSPLLMKNKQLKIKCNSGAKSSKHWPLGHGEFRISGNLGPLVPTIADAKQNGFDDVLWMLDDYIKEFTILNVFVLWKSRYGENELITPPTDGCIFNGTLRKSIVELKDKLFKEKGVKLVERQISIHEIINAYNEGRMLEVFGASTSSSIQSVNRIVY